MMSKQARHYMTEFQRKPGITEPIIDFIDELRKQGKYEDKLPGTK